MLRATLGKNEEVTVLVTDTASPGVYECTLCVLRDNWRVFTPGTLLLKVSPDGREAVMVGRAAKQLIHRETGQPAEGYVGSLLAAIQSVEAASALHDAHNLQKLVDHWFRQHYDLPDNFGLTLVDAVSDGMTEALLGVPLQISREAAYQGYAINIDEDTLAALVLRENVGWEMVEGAPDGESENFISSMGVTPGVAYLVVQHGYRFQRRASRASRQ